MNKEFVVRVVGGIGNILFQMSAATMLRPELYAEERIKFAGANKESHLVLATYIKEDMIAPFNTQAPTANPVGYWQHVRWVPDAHPMHAWFKDPIPTKAHVKAVDMFDLHVHIRGGDFLKSAAHKSCRMGESTILQAMDTLDIDTSKVLIVTDDFSYVKSLLGTKYAVLGSLDPIVAFHTMCKSRNLIIYPGSTFSWWAARLGSQWHSNVFFPATGWPHDGLFGYQDITSAYSSDDMCMDFWRKI